MRDRSDYCADCGGRFKRPSPTGELRVCRRCRQKGEALLAGLLDESDLTELSNAEFDELASYLERGLSFREAEDWVGTPAEEVEQWIEAGYRPQEAANWDNIPAHRALRALHLGLRSIEELDLYEKWEAWGDVDTVRGDLETPPDVAWSVEFGLDLATATEWEAFGFVPGEHIGWMELGILPRDARSAIFELDLSPKEFGEWIRAGASPQTVIEIVERGDDLFVETNPDELRRAGVPLTVDGIERWGGLTASEILDAVDRGFSNSADFLPYRGTSLIFLEVERLRANGTSEPSDIIEAALSQKLGISVPELRFWQRSGFRSDQISAWRRTGLDPMEASDWRDRLFSASATKKWLGCGMRRPLDASAWREAGYDASEAQPWVDAGVSVADAKRWTDASVDTPTAIRRIAAGLRPPRR